MILSNKNVTPLAEIRLLLKLHHHFLALFQKIEKYNFQTGNNRIRLYFFACITDVPDLSLFAGILQQLAVANPFKIVDLYKLGQPKHEQNIDTNAYRKADTFVTERDPFRTNSLSLPRDAKIDFVFRIHFTVKSLLMNIS